MGRPGGNRLEPIHRAKDQLMLESAGHPIKEPWVLLFAAAAVVRICASWHTEYAAVLLLVAGACWIAAFGLFELVYGPMLLSRRSAS